MKLINKLGILLCAAAFLTACDDEVSYSGPGKWDAAEGYQSITFTETSVEEELDPSEACVATFQVKREVVDSASTIPFTILENTDDVFMVTEPTFAVGDSVADFSFMFTNAELGKPYTLKIQITDPNYTSIYSQDNVFTYTVTRIKWNLLGKGNYADNYYFEADTEVDIYVKDGDNTIYRVVRPYENILSAYGIEPSPNITSNIQLQILQNGETFMGVDIDKDDLVYFGTINTGYTNSTYGADVKAYHPFNLYADPTVEDVKQSKVLAYQSDDVTPGQIALAPYYYMDGIGGWDATGEKDAIVITFPGYTPSYVATIENDFDWEEVFVGDFTSGKTGAVGNAALYKGTCNTDEDACDSIFAANYGTPYAIANPYTEGFNIYFCVKEDGTITIPEENALQSTGLVALGDTVYAKINTDQSTFEERRIVLNMTFQNEDGSLVYGSADEVLEFINWNEVGTVDYVYTLFFGDDYDDDGNCTKPYYDNGLTLLQREDKPEVFKILEWGYGVDFYFTWNQETNEMTVPAQYTGYTHPSYGDVMVSDIPTYTGGEYTYDDAPCSFNPETGVATVNVLYFVSAGVFTDGEETFTIHLDSYAKGNKVAKKNVHTKKVARPSTSMHRKNVFKGTKVNNAKGRQKSISFPTRAFKF